jgi:hypothetical protein
MKEQCRKQNRKESLNQSDLNPLTAGAGLSHGGAEGSAAHRNTTLLIYNARRGFGSKEEHIWRRVRERSKRKF